MKAIELKARLLEEGCNEDNFAVLSRRHDAYCLERKGKTWSVYYYERGLSSDPVFTSNSEQEACEFFYNHIMQQQHWHIVGFFKCKVAAQALENKLQSIGITPIRNDMPGYKTATDTRYRVFVVGKDIFKARSALGNIELNYD